jgi:Domain of Unknown Function (DUF1206)
MSVKREAKREARRPWVGWLGRAGLAAMGISFGIVAVLALELAFGVGGKATDRGGALHTIGEHPLGKVLLVLLAIGFGGYALWRLAQAIFNRGGEDDDAAGWGKRASELGKAGIYLWLLAETLGILFGLNEGGGGGGGGGKERGIAAWFLRHPGGKWIVAAAGLAIIGAGLWNLYRALSGQFRKHLKEHEMKKVEEDWVIPVAVVGYTARAVVFCLIGVFVVHAAWETKPKDAIGLDGALRKVANAPYGPVLLGLVAAGLLAYALYCLVQARYREV